MTPHITELLDLHSRMPLWAKAGLPVAALFVAATIARKSKRKGELNQKVVLITGSRGLGLALAYELGRRGARMALCARDAAELQEACRRLREEGIEGEPFPCDLQAEAEIEPLVNRVLDRFGRIDILVNNAGIIQVGPLETLEMSDFEHAMNLMFWSPLKLTFAVLPYMKKQASGQIVNITSIGGRVSVPHLLPYSCAKFALVGFSSGLSTEVRRDGIHVLTVVPGLMRTGSYLKAEFKGKAKNEFAWFSLMSTLPVFAVSANYAARCIRKAIEKKSYVCTISLPAKILIGCETFLPDLTRRVLETGNRFLPHGAPSKEAIPGHSLDPQFGKIFHALTALGKRAARALNERPVST